ncbi:DNA cytosine methyltransferase [Sinorhizobium meliloti]|uniref:DNA cytosine methyltransferase n=1 Tax=Rhizobium meliloti TaxID=382 RepID=UPI000FE0BF6B|nr:DNA cytosine methyltransferase [Sinorhizobium meliloti]RVL94723.1 hypothetical protein CN136_21650 [Sinorhizobium meliloti]
MKAIEVYAGVGGLGIGLEAAGIEVVHGHDIDPKVHRVRYANGISGYLADASDISMLASRIAFGYDMICGGPPCQDFSVAGHQIPGKRAELTVSFALLIGACRPEWFMYENVRRAGFSRQYQKARRLFKGYGYGLTELVLDTASYTVPQSRKRFVVIGRMHERDGFLEAAIQAESTAPQPISTILDPADPDDANLIRIGGYFTRPFGDGRGVRRLDEPAPAVYRTFRDPPYGKDLEARNPKDHIPAWEAHEITQPQMSRIQGFPRDFDWYSAGATVKEIDVMIANAVPPPFAYYLGKVIKARHTGKDIPKIDPRFRTYLEKKKTKGKKLSKPAVANILSRLNRARRLLNGRTFADVDLETNTIDKISAKKQFDVRLSSDLRTVCRTYSKWLSENTKKSRFDLAPKPWKPLFGRRETSWEPRWIASEPVAWVAEHELVPAQTMPLSAKALGISLNGRGRRKNKTDEKAYLAHKAEQDFDPHPEDDGRLSPPALDPDEMWRPDGYDDD